MDILDFMKDHGVWIATIIAAIIAGVFGLMRKSSNRNSQKIKDVNNSNIQQSSGSINITLNKTNKENNG
jgi:ABC-type Na+ efflux pump permease subunit